MSADAGHAAAVPGAAPGVDADGATGRHALADALTARSDDELAALLRARPDLASPAPSSFVALAARAATRTSVERALATLDATELAVAEAAVALAPMVAAPATGLGADDVATAIGLPTGPVAAALGTLEHLALLVAGRPVQSLVEALGPYPAGLGPTLANLGEASAAPGTTGTSGTTATSGVPATSGTPTTPAAPATREDLAAVLADAPPAARRTLDALTWGPPVGTTGAAQLPAGAAWLVERGILARPDRTHVVLPREVALAAREGRTHRAPPAPPSPAPPVRGPATVEAESARAAAELVRRTEALLAAWAAHPAGALRSGGLRVREVRRTGQALGLSDAEVIFVAEVAAGAGLLWRSEDDPVEWAPSIAADEWRADGTALRWAALAAAWLASPRRPWLAGTREASGALRAALSAELEAPWVARLRTEVLAILTDLDAATPGAAPDAADVAAVLHHRRPRAQRRDDAVAHVLTEFANLGITGAGALSAAGRALAEGGPHDGAEAPDAAGAPGTATDDGGVLAAADALEAALPRPVRDLFVQGDLTAVVPGTPAVDLAELLETAAEIESRGGALTVRFTATSIRRALDSGRTAEELLGELRGFSRTPLPQPLEYLVGDVARKHGVVRAGAAGTYLRADDAAPLLELLGRPELSGLELRALAPTVLVSPESPDIVLRELRAAGLAPVAEGASGQVVRPRGFAPGSGAGGVGSGAGGSGTPFGTAGAGRPGGFSGSGVRGYPRGGSAQRRRSAARESTYPGSAPGMTVHGPSEADLAAVVARARAGQEAAQRTAQAVRDGDDAALLSGVDPVLALETLRTAVAENTLVDVVLVGASGAAERRRVRVLAVEQGRVRMRDATRDVEITVAVHRIGAAIPVDVP